MPETSNNINVRYETDVISEFLKESGSNNLHFTNLLEKSEEVLMQKIERDDIFVNQFNELVGSNKDYALLLAVHMIADYDDMGEKSKERVRNAIKDAVMGSQKDLLEPKFKLLKAISGRLAVSNIEDRDMKLFDLVSDLVNFRSVDISATSEILRDINNDIEAFLQKIRNSVKKETPLTGVS